MNKVLTGKKLQNKLELNKEEVLAFKRKYGKYLISSSNCGRRPHMSKVYVNSKVRACEELGIYSEKHVMKAETTETELLELIDSL